MTGKKSSRTVVIPPLASPGAAGIGAPPKAFPACGEWSESGSAESPHTGHSFFFNKTAG